MPRVDIEETSCKNNNMKSSQNLCDVIDKAAVAKSLRYYRRQKGWTQEQLSERSGVTVRTIQRIENAKVEPHLQTLVLLAGSLELEVNELLTIISTENIPTSNTPDRKWLLLMHLSPIVGFIIPFSNLIIPLLLWVYKREDHSLFDTHGRAVVNFHFTVTVTFMVGVVLLLVIFELGILLLIFSSVYALALILLNTRRVIKNESYTYPRSLKLT